MTDVNAARRGRKLAPLLAGLLAGGCGAILGIEPAELIQPDGGTGGVGGGACVPVP